MRERRMVSMLDHGGFLLTACPKSLGLTSDSLDRFKAGLSRAMHMADRIADVAADPEITYIRGDMVIRLASLQLHGTGSVSDEDIEALRDAEYEALVEYTKALRAKQTKIICNLSAIDLAFLLTLAEGAMVGWQRYMAKHATSDVRFYNKMDAFGELVFREGSFMLWAFVRGTGGILAFANTAVSVVADQLWQHEVGFDQNDGGLSKAIHKELKQRLHDVMWEVDPCFDVAELEDPMVVKQWAHELVGEKIGCKKWEGYYAVA